MSVIEHQGYFTSLPREYYTSQELFDLEVSRVFETQWIYVGHTCQIRAAGDYFVARAASESVIVLRDDGGGVRAFFNTCRHRGSELCAQASAGRAKQIVCPYHRWSWALDGHLLGAPGSRDGVDFDYADWPLHEAACDVFHGCVYVHLGRPESSVAEILGDRVRTEDFATFGTEQVKLIREVRYPINANWKLALENNLECYHCAGSHPSLGVACDYQGFFVERDGSVRDPERQRNPGHFPLRDGMETFSMDGKWVSRRRLGTGPPAGSSHTYVLAPMYAAISYFADHGVNLALSPVDKDHAELLAQWFVHEDAVEGVDYEVDAVCAVFDVTNREDKALIEGNMRGVRSRRFEPGPNSATRENFLQDVLGEYLALMDAPVTQA